MYLHKCFKKKEREGEGGGIYISLEMFSKSVQNV